MQNFSDRYQGISVLMPTYKHQHFIARAITSLQLQTFTDWELIVINDGSPDDTEQVLISYLEDERIRYIKNESNRGLDFCLNQGLKAARFDLIAYLPSDDIFYKDHLASLCQLITNHGTAIGAYSNVRSEFYDEHELNFPNDLRKRTLQLVQVIHKKLDVSWVERSELVTDSLDRMFFDELRKKGALLHNNTETCQWTNHEQQRFKIVSERFTGGIFKYRLYYNVSTPLIYHTTFGNYIDEFKLYEDYRFPRAIQKDGLKILLVGELAYNPERIYALEENGHTLYGLWCDEPWNFSAVGPLPFGNIEDISHHNWRERVREIHPDIIYALLNWQAIDLAHEVLMSNDGIPFIWHFKEGPFFCMKMKFWNKLVDLYNLCDGRIFTNKETEDWFGQFVIDKDKPSLLLDGDLPKADRFSEERSDLLSERDGEIHTVLAGRPIGFEVNFVRALTEQKIHLHFYGDLFQNLIKTELEDVRLANNPYFHIHPHCDQANWVKEFSRYDAGWLHLFNSENYGELLRADWNDLNYPARIATLASAGVPMIQRDNTGHIVATQALTKRHDIGIFFNNIRGLSAIFKDKNRMQTLRNNAWNSRKFFRFDTYVEELVSFFNEVIHKTNGKSH